MKKLSFIISNHNTLNYSKLCYQSIRKNLNQEHEIILLADGCTDGTNEWIAELSLTDSNVKTFISTGESIGIAYMYNKGVELASNEYICLLHSDMYVPVNFDKTVLKYISEYDFITTCRVEPSLYPPSDDKIQKDTFGLTFDKFNEKNFNTFALEMQNNTKQNSAMFFPFVMKKELYESVGGCDTLFLKYMVDDDDFYYRLVLSGIRYTQIFDTCVYHFCSRSSKFANDEIHSSGNNDWMNQYRKSTRNFIRKWGYTSNNIINGGIMSYVPSLDIALVYDNDNQELLKNLEPYFSVIYCKLQNTIDIYIKENQQETLIDLSKKLLLINDLETYENDIIIKIKDRLTDVDMNFINNMHKVLFNLNKVGNINNKNLNLNIFVKQIKDTAYTKVKNERKFKLYKG